MPRGKSFFVQHKKLLDIMRNGPRPLWLHLNAGAAMMAALADDETQMNAACDILQEAMAGVQAYHNSKVKPFRRDMKIIAQENGTKLLSSPEWQGRDIVLLVPSLINDWHIFDIEEDFSFAAHLYEKGFTPIIVEWAEPQNENIAINDYINRHLLTLLNGLVTEGDTIKGLIGYCMGGTMITALLSAYPEIQDRTGKVVLIAPPWDFSYQSVEQAARLQFMAMQTYAMASPVPTDFVQSLFWALDPLQVLKKFRKFPHVSKADRFVRVEDWLNAGRSVSLSVIQTCLFDWYRDNKIAKGEWTVNGCQVTPKSLGNPTMIATATRDNLVPFESTLPLLDCLPKAHHIEVDTGHIGLMASDKSVAALWNPIAEFLK